MPKTCQYGDCTNVLPDIVTARNRKYCETCAPLAHAEQKAACHKKRQARLRAEREGKLRGCKREGCSNTFPDAGGREYCSTECRQTVARERSAGRARSSSLRERFAQIMDAKLGTNWSGR